MTSDSPFSVLELGGDDQPRFEQLMDVFGAAFNERQTYMSARPDAAYVRRLLDDEGFFALAAVSGGAVIGGLCAYELKKFEQRRSEIYIYDLAVAESHRRRGVATALIDRLKTIARARGAWVISVQADHGDDPAIALYSKLGVREDVLHFDIAPD
ncbi:MAG: AAC(3)-I family aminoglycoside N-acetyltransferase [Beijerinckiaceae bacterium]